MTDGTLGTENFTILNLYFRVAGLKLILQAQNARGQSFEGGITHRGENATPRVRGASHKELFLTQKIKVSLTVDGTHVDDSRKVG